MMIAAALLALQAPAAAPADPGDPFGAAVSAWARCASERTRIYSATPRRDRHVISAALYACYDEERALQALFVQRFGKKRGRRAMRETIEMTRRRLTEDLRAIRGR